MNLSPPQALNHVLNTAMRSNPQLIVLGDAVGRSGGLDGCTAGLLERFGPERVWDTPIAERGQLGVALGLALGGKRVIVHCADLSRTAALIEPLTEAVAISQADEFHPNLTLLIPVNALDACFDSLAHCGAQILIGSNSQTLAALLQRALSHAGPSILLYPSVNTGVRSPLNAESIAPSFQQHRAGTQLHILCWGPGLQQALVAAKDAEKSGYSFGVIELNAPNQLDWSRLTPLLSASGRILVAHQGPFGRTLLQQASDHCFLSLESPPVCCAPSAAALLTAGLTSVHF